MICILKKKVEEEVLEEVCTNYVSETGVKSASCNPKRKQEVTAKQKLCSENKGELKNPGVYSDQTQGRYIQKKFKLSNEIMRSLFSYLPKC